MMTGQENIIQAYRIGSDQSNAMLSDNPNSGIYMSDVSCTLDTTRPDPSKAQGGMAIVQTDNSNGCAWNRELVSQTLTTRNAGGSQRMPDKDNFAAVIVPEAQNATRYIVRRLTPLEAERLQGLPDNYTDIGEWIDSNGKKRQCTDSMRYKAIGNGIAVPPWLFVLSRLNEYCEDKTMASLFTGISTFPLIWSFLNDEKSCVWCCEIDDFPTAVSKFHFPEDDANDE